MTRKYNNFFSLDSSERFLCLTLEEACRSGNISLAKEAILRGAINLQTAFQVASEKGHICIVKFLLSFDKRFSKTSLARSLTTNNDDGNDGNDGNNLIATSDDAKLSKIRDQNSFTFNLTYAWTMSCRYNHLRLAKLLVTDYGLAENNGAENNDDLLNYIVHYGNMELLEWYLSKYPDSQKSFHEYPDRYLLRACSGDSVNSLAVVKLLISKGAQNISHGLSNACLKPSGVYNHCYKFTDARYKIVVYLLTLLTLSTAKRSERSERSERLPPAKYWQESYNVYIDHKRLVENGLSLDILKTINNALFSEISERRSRVVDDASKYLIMDLGCIIGSYVID